MQRAGGLVPGRAVLGPRPGDGFRREHRIFWGTSLYTTRFGQFPVPGPVRGGEPPSLRSLKEKPAPGWVRCCVVAVLLSAHHHHPLRGWE